LLIWHVSFSEELVARRLYI